MKSGMIAKSAIILFLAVIVSGLSQAAEILDPSNQEEIRELLLDLEKSRLELTEFANKQLDESLRLKQNLMTMDRDIRRLEEMLTGGEALRESPGVVEEKKGSIGLDLVILTFIVLILIGLLFFLRNRRRVQEEASAFSDLDSWTDSEKKETPTTS